MLNDMDGSVSFTVLQLNFSICNYKIFIETFDFFDDKQIRKLKKKETKIVNIITTNQIV